MERSPASYLWVLFFAFQLWTYGCLGCLDKEKCSLLELKSSINHPNGTSLHSWRVGADCCSWKGVTCSSTTGRVIELDISRTRDFEFRDWYLNASLLLPLEELRSLKLRDNWLSGFIDEEGISLSFSPPSTWKIFNFIHVDREENRGKSRIDHKFQMQWKRTNVTLGLFESCNLFKLKQRADSFRPFY